MPIRDQLKALETRALKLMEHNQAFLSSNKHVIALWETMQRLVCLACQNRGYLTSHVEILIAPCMAKQDQKQQAWQLAKPALQTTLAEFERQLHMCKLCTASLKHEPSMALVTPLMHCCLEASSREKKRLMAPYYATPRDYLSDTPLLRAMGFWCLSMTNPV